MTSGKYLVIGCFLCLIACSSQTIIIPSPSYAAVMLDGKPLENNILKYGRWVGNKYSIQISAPGFVSQELALSPELSDRAGAIALTCVATLVGIPFLPAVFWNGSLDDQIYVSLEQITANDH